MGTVDQEPPIKFGPILWPVRCAWCLAEGISRIVGWSTVQHSHSICEEHAAEVRAETERVLERERRLTRGGE